MNQVKAGAILNYVIIGLNTLLGLLYTPYMLHMLGQNEYGLYSLVASIIAYLTILDFGFGNAIVRYTAKFRAEGKLREQWEMFGMFLIVYTLIGFAAFLIGLGLYFNVEALFERTMSAEEVAQARTMIMLLIVNLAITFPFSMFGSIITAYEDFVFQKVVAIVRLLLCTSVIILLLHVGYRAVAMVAAQTAFNIATLLLNYLYCVRKIKIKIAFSRFNRLFVKEITIYSFWLFLNTIMDRIYWSTGQFVLGAVVGTAAVAVYSVAILLQQMYMSFSTSIANVLLPKITAMVSLDKGARGVGSVHSHGPNTVYRDVGRFVGLYRLRTRVHRYLGGTRICDGLSDHVDIFRFVVRAVDPEYGNNHPSGSQPNEIPIFALSGDFVRKPHRSGGSCPTVRNDGVRRLYRRGVDNRPRACNECLLRQTSGDRDREVLARDRWDDGRAGDLHRVGIAHDPICGLLRAFGPRNGNMRLHAVVRSSFLAMEHERLRAQSVVVSDQEISCQICRRSQIDAPISMR